MDTNTAYTYFAFISYKHDGKDAEFANDLQKTLGEFKLPVSIIDKEPGLKDGVKPVFVDITELGGHPTLSPAIKKALRESRFLIVICSPRSAKSEWVNKEIQYFVKLKRIKRIIPFIIEGCPNSKDENVECCTPTMKELIGEQDLLGISINELGFDVAVVKVVSRMFKVRFSSLWNIYEKEREKRQRELKEQNDRLMIAQSRFVAEKAISMVEEDSYLARLLALEVLPKDLENPDRPYTVEAERALRQSVIHNSTILYENGIDIKSAVFSPDQTCVLALFGDNTARLWNLRTGELMMVCDECEKGVIGADYINDGACFYSVSIDGVVRVRDLIKGNEIKALHIHTHILSYAFDLDGTRFAYIPISMDGKIYIREFETGKTLIISDSHSLHHGFVFFSPDGNRVISASDDCSIRIWNTRTGEELKVLVGHDNLVKSAVFSPDGSRIVSASDDCTVRIWDARSGEELKVLTGHDKRVKSAVFSPDGSRIVSASDDSTIRIWDVETGKELKTFLGHCGGVFSAVFSQDGKNIVSVSEDKTIRVWDAMENCTLRYMNGLMSLININISPDGSRLVSYQWYNHCLTLSLWDVIGGEKINVWKGHCSKNTPDILESVVAFAPNGTSVVAAAGDTIAIWNSITGKNIKVLEGNILFVTSVSYSLDGTKIIASQMCTSLNNNAIHIWDAKTGKKLKSLVGHGFYGTNSAVFSHDGNRVVSASYDGTVCIWDAKSGKKIKVLNVDVGCYSACFSPDGRFVVAAATDRKIYLWEKTSKKSNVLQNAFLGKGNNSVFSPDGAFMVYMSYDCSVRVLNVEEGKDVIVFAPLSNVNVLYASFTKNGRSIYSVYADGSIRFWDFPPLQELIDQTRKRFKGRPLTIEERKQYYLE